jgi:hypothetical protein
MLENPFFLALIHSALTKEVEEKELRVWAIAYKKRLMEKRMDIKQYLEDEMSNSSRFLIK